MKKVLLGSAVLTAFSLSIIAFQLSCQKSVSAQTTGYKPLNILLYTVEQPPAYTIQLWTANTDGTDQQQIPVSLPSGYVISSSDARLTMDGKTVIFVVSPSIGGNSSLYSCSLDGSNLKLIVQTSTQNLYLEGTY